MKQTCGKHGSTIVTYYTKRCPLCVEQEQIDLHWKHFEANVKRWRAIRELIHDAWQALPHEYFHRTVEQERAARKRKLGRKIG